MANTRFACVCSVCVLKLSQRTAEKSVFQWGNRWNRAGQQCDGWEVKDTHLSASSGLCDKHRGLDFFFQVLTLLFSRLCVHRCLRRLNYMVTRTLRLFALQ